MPANAVQLVALTGTVSTVPARGNPLRANGFYFDSRSGLLAKTVYEEGRGNTMEWRFSSWGEIAGSMFPGMIERFEAGNRVLALTDDDAECRSRDRNGDIRVSERRVQTRWRNTVNAKPITVVSGILATLFLAIPTAVLAQEPEYLYDVDTRPRLGVLTDVMPGSGLDSIDSADGHQRDRHPARLLAPSRNAVDEL